MCGVLRPKDTKLHIRSAGGIIQTVVSITRNLAPPLQDAKTVASPKRNVGLYACGLQGGAVVVQKLR